MGNQLSQQFGSLPSAGAPDNVPSGRCVPLVAHLFEPLIKKTIPLAIGGDPERLQIPAVLAVMSLGQLGPYLGSLRIFVVPEGDRTLPQHLRILFFGQEFRDERDDIQVIASSQAERHDAKVGILVLQAGVD